MERIEMVKDGDGHYVPLECCSMTNPATSGGVSMIDDIDLPCGSDCGNICDTCIVQKIMDEYAKVTGQIK